jgi:putative membrane protein
VKLLIRFALMVGAVWLTFAVVPGLSTDGGWAGPVIVAILLAIANAFVLPIIRLFTIPIRILTLGLFTLAVNVLVIAGVIILAQNSDLGLSSDGFGATLLGAAALTVLSSLISWIVKD